MEMPCIPPSLTDAVASSNISLFFTVSYILLFRVESRTPCRRKSRYFFWKGPERFGQCRDNTLLLAIWEKIQKLFPSLKVIYLGMIIIIKLNPSNKKCVLVPEMHYFFNEIPNVTRSYIQYDLSHIRSTIFYWYQTNTDTGYWIAAIF